MGIYVKKLTTVTFSLHHSPNCAYPYQVHLVGNDQSILDNVTFSSITKDILGHGHTFEEAAKEAWQKKFGKKKAGAKR